MLALLDSLRLAVGTFRANPLRALLTLVGIVIGVATVVTMMALIEGLRRDVNRQLSMLGANSFQVSKMARGFNRNDDKMRKRPNLTLADREAIAEHCPSVRSATGEGFENGQKIETSLRQTRPSVSVWAVTSQYLDTNGLTLERGRSFTDQEDRDGRRVVLLGTDVVETLFPDQSPLDQEIRLRGRPFRVIGVLEHQGAMIGGGSQDNQVVIPLTAFGALFGTGKGIEISISATEAGLVSRAQDEVTVLLRQRRGVKPEQENNFEFFSNATMTKTFNQLSGVITAATFGVCFLSLVVGGIGILNIMLVSVTERTREIGVRKALGARKRNILAQFAVEAVLLSLSGGVIGISLGYGAAFLGRWALDFPTAVPAWAVAASVAMSSGVGLLFGIYPAARAARLDPVEAMRSE